MRLVTDKCTSVVLLVLIASTVPCMMYGAIPSKRSAIGVEQLKAVPADTTSLELMVRTEDFDSLDLTGFTALEDLLIEVDDDTDLAAPGVKFPSSLRKLEIIRGRIPRGEKTFDNLSSLENLVQLRLRPYKLDAEAFRAISKLKRIETLALNGIRSVEFYDTPFDYFPSVDLRACATVVDAITALTSLKNLELELSEFPSGPMARLFQSLKLVSFKSFTATDASIQLLCAFCPSLTSLNLESNGIVTDYGLQFLEDLPALTSLNLAGCRHVGDFGLPYLSRCVSLQELDLSANVMEFDPSRQWDEMYPRKHIVGGFGTDEGREFRINGVRVYPFVELAKLSDLRRLSLANQPNIEGTALQDVLLGMPKLEYLDISGCSRKPTSLAAPKDYVFPPDADLSFFSEMKHLTTMKIESSWMRGVVWMERPAPLTPELLRALIRAPALRVLSLAGAEVPAGALGELLTKGQLDELNLVASTIIGDLKVALPEQATISKLRGGSTVYSPSQIALLERLPRLTRLSIVLDEANAAEQLTAVNKIKSLQVLTLWISGVNGKLPDAAGFAPLAQSKTLRSLYLYVRSEKLKDPRVLTPWHVEIRKVLPKLNASITTSDQNTTD